MCYVAEQVANSAALWFCGEEGMVQSGSSMFYVNPSMGNDNADGTQANPYRTITRALRQATTGTRIQLSAGTYSVSSGEIFPLVVPPGVSLLGNESNKGNSIVIDGNGEYVSPSFGSQNVAVRLENGSQLRGITITNRAAKGTGVWIESAAPTVANNTFINCGREGVFATGNANPEIVDNVFQQNAASGVSIVRNAKGEIQRNTFQRTGFGIAIGNNAAPLVMENRVVESRSGIVITGSARPVLRNNILEKNTNGGLVVENTALPDIGKPQDPGGNVFRDNGEVDLRNAAPASLVSVGNQINPTRIQGKIELAASQVFPAPPAPIATSPTASPAPVTTPRPTPQPAPAPQPIPRPTPQPSQQPTPRPAPTPSGEGRLTDIRGHWAEPFITALVDRDIITGFPDGTFKPELKITRAQYAVVIANTFDLPPRPNYVNFLDVPSDFWAAIAIGRAGRMGFVSGFPDRTFRPNQNLRRIDTIVSLVSGLGLTAGNHSVLTNYTDRDQVPTYATGAVAIATQRRIIVNHPRLDQLEPLIDITRAEVAAMVYQALVATGRAPAIASPYIVNPDTSVPSFADVQTHWAEPFIQGLTSQGFISGFSDGTFKPDAGMSRAQFAAVLVSAFNPTPQAPVTTFSDIPEKFWAAAAIQRAYRGGLLSGFADNTFRPNESVSRLEVITALTRGLSLPGSDPDVLTVYQDADQLPEAVRPAIASATTQNLVVNYPEPQQLEPDRAATRAEVAAMVYQALAQTARLPALSSNYVAMQPN
jgi:parallel beta-helix repeat protein